MITDLYCEKVKNLDVGDILCDLGNIGYYAGVILSVVCMLDGVMIEILFGGKARWSGYRYGEWVEIASEIDGVRL